MWVSPLNLLYFVFNLHARAQVICSISYWLGPAFKTSLTRTMTPAGRSSSLHGTIHRVRGLTAFGTIFIGVVVAEGLVWFLAPVAFQSCGAAWKCNEGLMFRPGGQAGALAVSWGSSTRRMTEKDGRDVLWSQCCRYPLCLLTDDLWLWLQGRKLGEAGFFSGLFIEVLSHFSMN